MTRSTYPPTQTIAPLTGIRGVAAIWVVLYHMRDLISAAYPDWPAVNRIIAGGYLGVDLFAFLSGFIIAYTYSERLQSPSGPALRRYLWLRFIRTYPLHVFVLGLLLLLAAHKGGWDSLAAALCDATFWRQLFLLHGLGFENQLAWNVPSWSLSSEWACYLAFPAVAPFLLRVKNGLTATMLAIATLVATIVVMSLLGQPEFQALLGWGLVRIAGEFFTGCWLYRIHSSGVLSRWPMGWIGMLAVLGILAAHRLPTWQVVAPVAVTALSLLILALAQNQQPLRWVFGNRLAVYLGEISYSVYMLHWLVLSNVKDLGFRELPMRWRILAVLVTLLLGAALSYHGVEQVSRRKLRNFGLGRDA